MKNGTVDGKSNPLAVGLEAETRSGSLHPTLASPDSTSSTSVMLQLVSHSDSTDSKSHADHKHTRPSENSDNLIQLRLKKLKTRIAEKKLYITQSDEIEKIINSLNEKNSDAIHAEIIKIIPHYPLTNDEHADLLKYKDQKNLESPLLADNPLFANDYIASAELICDIDKSLINEAALVAAINHNSTSMESVLKILTSSLCTLLSPDDILNTYQRLYRLRSKNHIMKFPDPFAIRIHYNALFLVICEDPKIFIRILNDDNFKRTLVYQYNLIFKYCDYTARQNLEEIKLEEAIKGKTKECLSSIQELEVLLEIVLGSLRKKENQLEYAALIIIFNIKDDLSSGVCINELTELEVKKLHRSVCNVLPNYESIIAEHQKSKAAASLKQTAAAPAQLVSTPAQSPITASTPPPGTPAQSSTAAAPVQPAATPVQPLPIPPTKDLEFQDIDHYMKKYEIYKKLSSEEINKLKSAAMRDYKFAAKIMSLKLIYIFTNEERMEFYNEHIKIDQFVILITNNVHLGASLPTLFFEESIITNPQLKPSYLFNLRDSESKYHPVFSAHLKLSLQYLFYEKNDAYTLLGLPLTATLEEAKFAKRQKLLKWHPDKNRDQLAKATEKTKQIYTAFDKVVEHIEKRRKTKFDPNTEESKLNIIRISLQLELNSSIWRLIPYTTKTFEWIERVKYENGLDKILHYSTTSILDLERIKNIFIGDLIEKINKYIKAHELYIPSRNIFIQQLMQRKESLTCIVNIVILAIEEHRKNQLQSHLSIYISDLQEVLKEIHPWTIMHLFNTAPIPRYVKKITAIINEGTENISQPLSVEQMLRLAKILAKHQKELLDKKYPENSYFHRLYNKLRPIIEILASISELPKLHHKILIHKLLTNEGFFYAHAEPYLFKIAVETEYKKYLAHETNDHKHYSNLHTARP